MAEGGSSRRTVRRVHSGRAGKPPVSTTPSTARGQRLPTVPIGGGPLAPQQLGQGLAADHMARLESDLSIKAENLVLKAKQIDESLSDSVRDETDRAKQALEQAKRHAEEVRTRATANVRAAMEQRRAEITTRLSDLAAIAAPGPFGADFADDWTRGDGGLSGAPSLVRRGVVNGQAALYPLFHDKGWFLDGAPHDTIIEVHTQVLRAVAGLPLKHLRIDVYDPRIEGKLGEFAQLRSVHPAAFPVPTTSASEFLDVLKDITKIAAANAEAIATDQVKTLGGLWQARGTPFGEYCFIVVLNYPEGINVETQELLVRLARSGGLNGVSLLVQHDKEGVPSDESIRASDLSQYLRKSRIEKSGELLLADYPVEVSVSLDGPAPVGLVSDVITAALERATSDTGPIVPLKDLIGDEAARPWQEDSIDGLEARIARAGQRVVSISLRSQNPPVSNILIGGAVGQGKSNLLLDIIYALASRYSPDHLELHLLDFKRGLEFQRFAADSSGKNWLPHTKVLSLESDKAFGVAVLRHVVRELENRADLFKKSGVSGIEDYRRKTGRLMPRLLLIVDEFQVLLDGDDRLTDEAVELLETLSRQGRASGVHLLLSSQTTTGVSGLRVKGESIFAQFPLRISLKNTANESETILSQGNKAAADLTYRGEIIVNRNFGYDPEGSNERAISAYADPGFVEDLQRTLWALRPEGEGPLVFVSTDFAVWPSALPEAEPRGPWLGLIGRPVEVTDEPVALAVDEDVDQAIAVVGSEESLAIPVVAGLVRSLTVSMRTHRVIVIDLSVPSDNAAGSSFAVDLQELVDRGIKVERFGRDRSFEGLAESVREVLSGEGERTLVVGIGWQRLTGLDDPHSVDPDNEDDFDTFTLREVMENLVQRGALKGVHFVGWWTTLRSLQDQLGYSYQGVRHFVTAKLGLEDYRSLTSHSEARIDGYPRVGHIDRASDRGPTVTIPFALREDV